MKPLFFCILLPSLLASCTMMRMKMPDDLASRSTIFEVHGRNDFSFGERVSFGPYRAVNFHRGWKTIATIGVSNWSTSETDASFSLRMPVPGDAWSIQCSTDMKQQRLDIEEFLKGSLSIELSSRTWFACALSQEGSGLKWFLKMDQYPGENTLRGALTGPSRRIDVQGAAEVENTSLPLGTASGYFFSEMGSMLGAVEVINNGRVFLPRQGGDSSLLAAASMALLYYRDERESGAN